MAERKHLTVCKGRPRGWALHLLTVCKGRPRGRALQLLTACKGRPQGRALHLLEGRPWQGACTCMHGTNGAGCEHGGRAGGCARRAQQRGLSPKPAMGRGMGACLPGKARATQILTTTGAGRAQEGGRRPGGLDCSGRAGGARKVQGCNSGGPPAAAAAQGHGAAAAAVGKSGHLKSGVSLSVICPTMISGGSVLCRALALQQGATCQLPKASGRCTVKI